MAEILTENRRNAVFDLPLPADLTRTSYLAVRYLT